MGLIKQFITGGPTLYDKDFSWGSPDITKNFSWLSQNTNQMAPSFQQNSKVKGIGGIGVQNSTRSHLAMAQIQQEPQNVALNHALNQYVPSGKHTKS